MLDGLMIRGFRNAGRLRKCLIGTALLSVVVAVSGCQTISFYSQAIRGQYQIFAHEEPTEKLLKSSTTPAPLKDRLQFVADLRVFAADKLKLPVDGHYRKYVDVHRPFVVWNVEAAPEFSLEPKNWWYPMVGSLGYRGYFSEAAAHKYGEKLKKKGDDVFIGGVEAYSTLGWFKDPLLNTFIFNPDADLAETLFHELGHQRVFARGDTDFNEAFATTVGQEGARRWLQSKGDTAAYENYLAELKRTRDFVHLIMRTRENLAVVYGDERTEDGRLKASNKKRDISPEQLRAQKKGVLEQMQREYAALKVEWGGNKEYDHWFARPVNNAQLNSVAAYYDFVPGFERLLALKDGDLEKFYEEAKRLASMSKKERQQWLRTLGESQEPSGIVSTSANKSRMSLADPSVSNQPRMKTNTHE